MQMADLRLADYPADASKRFPFTLENLIPTPLSPCAGARPQRAGPC